MPLSGIVSAQWNLISGSNLNSARDRCNTSLHYNTSMYAPKSEDNRFDFTSCSANIFSHPLFNCQSSPFGFYCSSNRQWASMLRAHEHSRYIWTRCFQTGLVMCATSVCRKGVVGAPPAKMLAAKTNGVVSWLTESQARFHSTGILNKSLMLLGEARASINKLHLAAEAGRAFDMQALLERGIVGMYSKTTPSGLTALHISAECGHTNLVHLLLHRGFDPFTTCAVAATPTALHMAIQNGHVDAVRAFISNKTDFTHVTTPPSLLHLACRSPNSEPIVRALLDAGLDASRRDDNGMEPIQVASSVSLINNGSMATVRLLADRGGDKKLLPATLQNMLQ